MTKYNNTDGKTILDPADDAATAKLGSPWRMPTPAEIEELLNPDNCTWTWITQDHVNGYEVKSKKNGNSIFLPAAGQLEGSNLYYSGKLGRYWSSSLSSRIDCGRHLFFNSDVHETGYYDRFYGYSVRPVRP